ncbi:MAG: transcriptional repressor [Myxococcota bacterium]
MLLSSTVRDGRHEIREKIRAAGLRCTPGRIAVYEALLEATRPLTHSDLVSHVTAVGVDQATIYRNLIDLVEAGLLRRSDLGDHSWRFEVPRADDPEGGHPHFVCIECGDIQCLSGIELNVPQARNLPRSIRKNEVELQIRGLCDNCH